MKVIKPSHEPYGNDARVRERWDEQAHSLARSWAEAGAPKGVSKPGACYKIERKIAEAACIWAKAADAADALEFEHALSACARAGALGLAAAACTHSMKFDGPCATLKARALAAELDAAAPRVFEAWERALLQMSRGISTFPGRAAIADVRVRTWAWAQLYAPRELALESARLGLGWPSIPASSNFSRLLRGIELDSDPEVQCAQLNPESMLNLFASQGLLGPALARVDKDGLLQTALRKTRRVQTVKTLCAAGSASGFAPGLNWEGSHPLWVAMRCPGGLEPPALLDTMESLMGLGFGPNMDLPAELRLSRAASVAATELPSLALEWLSRAPGWPLAEMAKLCARCGIDWEVRDSERGETALGALNRLARRSELQIQAESDFAVLVALGADPLAIVPRRSARALASTPELRDAAGAAEERAELNKNLDDNQRATPSSVGIKRRL